MAKPVYQKNGLLNKLGQVNKSWKDRWFAISIPKHIVYYFKTEEDFKVHMNEGKPNYKGSIPLENTIMYLADYMDRRFVIELAVRDAKNHPTRHFHLFANTGEELREWMVKLVEGGVTAAAPSFPMRVVPDGYKDKSEASAAAAAVVTAASAGGNNTGSPSSGLPKSYSSLSSDPALIPSLPFPCVLAKFGFLQKRGDFNSAYQTRFCRTEINENGVPILAYYVKPEDTKQKGNILLQSIEIDDHISGGGKEEDEKDDLCFRLTGASLSRTYVLRAPSKAQKKKWISILQRLSRGEKMATEEVKPVAPVTAVAPAAASSSSSSSPANSKFTTTGVSSPEAVVEEARARGLSSSVTANNNDNTNTNGAPRSSAASSSSSSSSASSTPAAAPGPAAASPSSAAATPAPAPTPVARTGPAQVAAPNGAAPGASASAVAPTAEQPKYAPKRVIKRGSVQTPGDGEKVGGGSSGTAAASPAQEVAAGSNSNAARPSSSQSPVAITDTPQPAAAATPVVRSGRDSPSVSHSRNSAAATKQALNQAASAPSPSAPSPSSSSAPPSAEVRASLDRCQLGGDLIKVPTSKFSKPERKHFFLLDVTSSEKAEKLIAKALEEIAKTAPKKLPYYQQLSSSKSGYLLHWESKKGAVHESFVWLNPLVQAEVDAAATMANGSLENHPNVWRVHWGQTHGEFLRHSLKSDLVALKEQSFSIQTSQRTFDLIVENAQEFGHWQTALREISQISR